MTTQAMMWGGAGAALALAVLAGVGDWRRVHRRREIDAIGWMPWRSLQVAALFASAAFAVLAVSR